MARIRSKNTKPEILVRKALHGAGLRFRLHPKDLPGKPDIVLPSRRVAVCVHGCFWHAHSDPACLETHKPKSRTDYWSPKLLRNVERDARHAAALLALGWRVETVWECNLRQAEFLPALAARLKQMPKQPRLQKAGYRGSVP